MLVYTLLFTLAHKDPKENKYVDMLMIWLTYVINQAGLTAQDSLAILVDERTFQHIQEIEPLSYLTDSAPCKVSYICIPPPLTLSEGMVARYTCFQTDICIYMDLDMLVVDSIRSVLPSLSPGSLVVLPEGELESPLYGGCLIPKDALPSMCGLSSGWFAYSPSKSIQDIFQHIHSECIGQSHTPFYTVDQPFFNKWVVQAIQTSSLGVQIHFLDDSRVENNSFEKKPSTVFINYCGEPGNGTAHATKMIGFLCLQHLTSTRE